MLTESLFFPNRCCLVDVSRAGEERLMGGGKEDGHKSLT